MWNTFGTYILRNRFWILVALGVFTLGMGFFATKVQMTYDFAKVIPQDDPDFIEYVKFKETFGEDGNIMVIGVQQDKLFQQKFFSDWAALCDDIEKIDGVEKVLSITKLYNLYKNDSTQLLELKPLVVSKFKTQSDVDSFERQLKDLRFYEGLLYNPESQVTLMAVTLKKDKLDSKARIPLVKSIEERANLLGEKHHTQIHLSGLPYVRTIYSSKVSDEIKIFTYLSIAVTA